jgi:hypothetical protein
VGLKPPLSFPPIPNPDYDPLVTTITTLDNIIFIHQYCEVLSSLVAQTSCAALVELARVNIVER